MPRTFAWSEHYRVSVEAVYGAFADRRYWLARLADSGADEATLDSMALDADGGVTVATTQRIRCGRLPALAAQFHGGDLEVVRSERWSAVHDRRAHADVDGKVLRAPARLTGEALLVPDGGGCTLNFTATVRIDVPLVGGKIESFIGARLGELITAEQRFTSTWIATGNHRHSC